MELLAILLGLLIGIWMIKNEDKLNMFSKSIYNNIWSPIVNGISGVIDGIISILNVSTWKRVFRLKR